MASSMSPPLSPSSDGGEMSSPSPVRSLRLSLGPPGAPVLLNSNPKKKKKYSAIATAVNVPSASIAQRSKNKDALVDDDDDNDGLGDDSVDFRERSASMSPLPSSPEDAPRSPGDDAAVKTLWKGKGKDFERKTHEKEKSPKELITDVDPENLGLFGQRRLAKLQRSASNSSVGSTISASSSYSQKVPQAHQSLYEFYISPHESPRASIVASSSLLMDKEEELHDTETDQMIAVFAKWDNHRRNKFIAKLYHKLHVPQIHLVSSLLELESGYPSNRRDILQWLPVEIALKILSYLDPVSLCRCSQVCRPWYRLAQDEHLWKLRVDADCYWWISTREWKQLEKSAEVDKRAWKKFYAERYRIKRNWTEGNYSVRTFEGHTQHISCLQFDDTKIVSGSSDRTIKIWNLRTNTQALLTLVGHEGTVRCLQFDEQRVVSGSNDSTIRIWTMNNGECVGILRGHGSSVRCLHLNGNTLVSGSYDTTLKVWDVEQRTCLRTMHGHTDAVLCVQFDETKIVSGSADTTIKVWDFKSGQCLRSLEGHSGAVSTLQFDETKIISGSLDSSLKFWDINTGEAVATLDWVRSEGHKGVVRNLKFDSWLMISAADDKTLKVWNLHSGRRMLTLQKHKDGVTCLQFNHTKIVSGSYDKTIKVWDFHAV